MQHVRTITQQCCSLSSSLRANVSSLLHNLLQRLTALEAYEKYLEDNTPFADENIDITESCPKPEILAQQLTHVELERLSYIGPEEFVQAFAKENPHIETSFKDMKKTRNLEQYVQWFNKLSYFVATQVIRVGNHLSSNDLCEHFRRVVHFPSKNYIIKLTDLFSIAINLSRSRFISVY